MKNLKNILFIVLAVTLIAGAFVLADTQRLGSDSYTFNPTRTVTKTAAYTLTTSDSYVKVTNSNANIVITLPSIVDALSGRRQSYKILKTDGTGYKVIVTPATGETIGFEATRYLISQNGYMVIHAGPGKNWTVDYESPYLYEDHAAGTAASGIFSAGVYSTVTGSVTLTVTDCGGIYSVATVSIGITLPATIGNCKYTFINSGADGANGIRLNVNAADQVFGPVVLGGVAGGAATVTYLATTAGNPVLLTRATAKRGDNVSLVGDGVDGWYIVTAATGTWCTACAL